MTDTTTDTTGTSSGVVGAPKDLDLSNCKVSTDGGKTSTSLSQLTQDVNSLKESSGTSTAPDLSGYVKKTDAYQAGGFCSIAASKASVGPQTSTTSSYVYNCQGYVLNPDGTVSVNTGAEQINFKYAVTVNGVTQEYVDVVWNTQVSGQTANRAFGGYAYHPQQDGGGNLGLSTNAWNNIYSKTSVTVTSDKNVKTEVDLKQDIGAVLFDNLNARTFKLNSAVDAKGDGARVHTGFFAQDIQKILQEANVDPTTMAMWIENPNATSVVVTDKKGDSQVQTKKIIDIDGLDTIQSLRYEEILVALFQGAKNKILSLEERLAALESKLGV